jgi:hypothetical protein
MKSPCRDGDTADSAQDCKRSRGATIDAADEPYFNCCILLRFWLLSCFPHAGVPELIVNG